MARTRSHRNPPAREPGPERVLVAGVQFAGVPTDTLERNLDELAALAESAGGDVVGRIAQRRDRPDPATFIGRGKVAQIADAVQSTKAELVVLDDELSPAQLRNLEEAVPVRVIDRTQLILDIFAQRAHSREGKTQVELAQLTYLLPRLRGWGIALSRIGGTSGAGGGGGRGAAAGASRGPGGTVAGGGRGPIGTRGPGETQLEVDRRRIQRRLKKLRADLDVLSKRRLLGRKKRDETVPTVSLVGYTNAGKSSILNNLTDAGVVVENRLFSTLDPTARRVSLADGRTIVLSDTVGFIRKLPHGLVEAFKSTLEEVTAADVLVHVVDASRADPEVDVAAVEEVLVEIGATHATRLLALNKVDLVPESDRAGLTKRFPGAVTVSAVTGEGIPDLLTAIGHRLDERLVEAEAVIPYDRGALLASLHDDGRVVSSSYEPGGVRVVVRANSAELGALARYLVGDPASDGHEPMTGEGA